LLIDIFNILFCLISACLLLKLKKTVKILLINPPEFKNSECIAPSYMYQSSAFNYPPLGLLYLASNLKGTHECKIIDAPTLGYSPDDCLKEIKKYNPSVIGMTVFSDSLYSCSYLTKAIKTINPDIKIVLGGPHINIYPGESIKYLQVDFVLTGFAENSFASLIEILENKNNVKYEDIPGLWWKNETEFFQSQNPLDQSWDINRINKPDRKLLDNDKYFTVANSKKIVTMLSSRGCPFSCTFCDVFEKRYLRRDVEDIIDELKDIDNLGISQVHFFDDCFNLKRSRVVDICNAILNNNLTFEWSFRGRIEPCDDELAKLLYKAGCRRVQLGIEGTNQTTIDNIKKKIDIAKVPKVVNIYKNNGIETMGYFIIGFPFQTYDDCVASCEEILKLGFDYINMFVLIPYPNTEIYNDLLSKKIIKNDYWYDHAVNPKPDFQLERWHPYVEKEKLEELLNKYYKKFYFSPKFIISEIRRTHSMNDFLNKIKVAFNMFKSKFS